MCVCLRTCTCMCMCVYVYVCVCVCVCEWYFRESHKLLMSNCVHSVCFQMKYVSFFQTRYVWYFSNGPGGTNEEVHPLGKTFIGTSTYLRWISTMRYMYYAMLYMYVHTSVIHMYMLYIHTAGWRWGSWSHSSCCLIFHFTDKLSNLNGHLISDTASGAEHKGEECMYMCS